MPVRRGMEAVSFGAQVLVRGGVTLGCLDAPERIDDRAVGLTTLDESGNRAGFLAEHDLDVLRDFNLVEILGQAAMIVLVALRDAAPVEAFGDDGVSDAQPEQLRVLQMTQHV